MEREIKTTELPFKPEYFEKQHGEIQWVYERCPGVYRIGAKPEKDRRYVLEYYVVMPGSPAISINTRRYGKPMYGDPNAVVYDCNDYYAKGRYVVDYDVYKYLEDQNIPLPEGESSELSRVLGMEVFPEYFGEFPVPDDTPWGKAKRFIKFKNGIYLLDIPGADMVLAIAYPYCSALSPEVLALASLPEEAAGKGMQTYYGYRFYSYQLSPLAIYELIWEGDEKIAAMVNMDALMNVIATDFPEYADRINSRLENDEDMIAQKPDAGRDFLRLPR